VTARPQPAEHDPAEPAEPAVAVFAPAPLLSIELEPSEASDADVHLHAGGQGFWVARMVRALRARPLLCAPFGGESGRVLLALIEHEGVEARAVEVDGANAVTMEDRRGEEKRTLVETPVPPFGRHDTDELYTITLGAAIEAGTCVVAGAQNAAALDDDVYRRLVTDLVANDVRVVADLCGSPLRAAVEGGLPLLKISHEELVRDGWADAEDVDSVVAGIEALRTAGAQDVVVSRAGDPAIAWIDGRLVEIGSPRFEVVEPRGAGDSMTAGLGVALARGLSVDDALRLATAAGALNVTRHGLATGHADAIEQLASRVEISDLVRP
jgi:1-phosphofructokinase